MQLVEGGGVGMETGRSVDDPSQGASMGALFAAWKRLSRLNVAKSSDALVALSWSVRNYNTYATHMRALDILLVPGPNVDLRRLLDRYTHVHTHTVVVCCSMCCGTMVHWHM